MTCPEVPEWPRFVARRSGYPLTTATCEYFESQLRVRGAIEAVMKEMEGKRMGVGCHFGGFVEMAGLEEGMIINRARAAMTKPRSLFDRSLMPPPRLQN